MNDFLTHLATLDINLKLDGGRLTVNAPPGVLTPALREQLSARKEELLALLHDQTALRPIPRRATAETRRQDDKVTGRQDESPCHPVTCHPVTLSSCHPVSPSPTPSSGFGFWRN